MLNLLKFYLFAVLGLGSLWWWLGDSIMQIANNTIFNAGWELWVIWGAFNAMLVGVILILYFVQVAEEEADTQEGSEALKSLLIRVVGSFALLIVMLNIEAGDSEYKEVAHIAERYHSIKADIKKFSIDEKLTMWEYLRIVYASTKSIEWEREQRIENKRVADELAKKRERRKELLEGLSGGS